MCAGSRTAATSSSCQSPPDHEFETDRIRSPPLHQALDGASRQRARPSRGSIAIRYASGERSQLPHRERKQFLADVLPALKTIPDDVAGAVEDFIVPSILVQLETQVEVRAGSERQRILERGFICTWRPSEVIASWVARPTESSTRSYSMAAMTSPTSPTRRPSIVNARFGEGFGQ
jgi:hypothetical protein